MTVNEAIKASKQTLKVFHKYGIDVCCGSHITLEEAAKKAGKNTEELLKELEKAKQIHAP
jgi:iron-sulfur cluster repair protein YtfE (RIC family)